MEIEGWKNREGLRMRTHVQVCAGTQNRPTLSTERDRSLNNQVVCDVRPGQWGVVPDILKDHTSFIFRAKWHFFFDCLMLKLKALQNFRMPRTTHPTTQCHMSEDQSSVMTSDNLKAGRNRPV
jgi:hypothetical protein